jgi:hypothetical protein
VLDLTAVWSYFGAWALGGRPEHPQSMGIVVDRFSSADVRVDEQAGFLLNKENRGLALREIVILDKEGVRRKEYGHSSEIIALVHQHDEHIYIVNREIYDTLPWRLFFRRNEGTPGFRHVYFEPSVGGVWKTNAGSPSP